MFKDNLINKGPQSLLNINIQANIMHTTLNAYLYKKRIFNK